MGRQKGTGMNIKENSSALGLSEEEYLYLLKIFADTGMSDLRKIQEAIVQGDREMAANAAHSLKGAAGSMGLADIYELSSDTERLLRCGRFDEADEVISSLEDKINTFEVQA
jgi:HPt (histidine-containing phosphotransfer) domain-containing protein